MTVKDNGGRTGRTGGCGICASGRGNRPGQMAAQENRRSCPTGQGVRWMRRLQSVDFALQELVLYLDVYPNCRRALEHYHKLRAEREQLVKTLQANGMPICAIRNDSHDSWDWINSPWPWEYDFIGNEKD